MSLNKNIKNVLDKKGSMTNIYPTPIHKSVPSIIDSKFQYYSDVIRMSTSDRNKAKATISVLERLYDLADINMQLLHTVFKEELDSVNKEERQLLLNKVANALDENDFVFYERGLEVSPVEGIYSEEGGITTEYVSDFMELYLHLLTATISVNSVTVNFSNIIDIVVHGEIDSTLLYKEAYPYPNSKLVTQYIHHLQVVMDELRNNPITYIKNQINN